MGEHNQINTIPLELKNPELINANILILFRIQEFLFINLEFAESSRRCVRRMLAFVCL